MIASRSDRPFPQPHDALTDLEFRATEGFSEAVSRGLACLPRGAANGRGYE